MYTLGNLYGVVTVIGASISYNYLSIYCSSVNYRSLMIKTHHTYARSADYNSIYLLLTNHQSHYHYLLIYQVKVKKLFILVLLMFA